MKHIDWGTVVAVLLPYSLGVTKGVDTLRNVVDRGKHLVPWVWNVAAFGLGVVLAFAFGVNVQRAVAPNLHTAMWTGEVLTGLGIGALSSWHHEFMDMVSSHAKAAKARAGVPPGDVVR